MGKLIVIEGLDASGKQTQTALICDALKNIGYKVKQISFPCYDSNSSALVKMYLNGDFGSTAENVNPYAASSFYAVDRYASFKTDWEKDYNLETIVVADRYTTSNMIHQAGKISDLDARCDYLDWLYEYEFKYLGLPKPDKVLFLEMPPEVSEKLMKERANKITGNAEKDIHEKDKNHLVKSYESALFVADRFKWDIVHCVQDNNLRTIDDIHSEILEKVLKEVK